MMNLNNKEIFEKALKTLNDNDRKTLEAFAQFLLVSADSSATPLAFSTQPTNLVDKANEVLLKDYIEFDVKNIKYSDVDTISIALEDRDKPLNFPLNWFKVGNGNLTNNIKILPVKFRAGSNRIDKVAINSNLLTDFGKVESKKRILALNFDGQNKVSDVATDVATVPEKSSDFVQKIIAASSNGWANTPAIAQVSVPKNNAVFSKLDSFKEGRLRLSRVGEILFNFIDQQNNKKYVWDSEFFFGAPHDFTNVKTGKTYDVKCHFHSSERLQLSQQTLNKCDADFIVAVLVEEDASTYTATVVGYITKADFTAKTKPWAYNEYVELRSLELHELNSPGDLF